MSRGMACIRADDLARIENMLRVKDVLQLAKHFVQRAVLLSYIPTAAQPVAMFAADCAADFEYLTIKVLGQTSQ